MTIKEIFDEIASESSTNKKVEILSKYKDNELLKRVLYLADSPRVKFYIKKIPDYTKDTFEMNMPLNQALNTLVEALPTRKATGFAATTLLQALLNSVSLDDAYIIERIIEKDCKINLGTTLINKVFPKLIEETPYMGAKSFDEKLVKAVFKDGVAYSQIKMDGRYCNAVIANQSVDLESRQGEPTLLGNAFFLKELGDLKDCVLNGELTMKGISRYESNGIIASLISIKKKELDGKDITKEISSFESEHMPYQQALDSIKFTCWDMITLEEYAEAKSSRPYYHRYAELVALLNSRKFANLSVVTTKEVNTYEEAIAHFQEVLAAGEEGTILKSAKGAWKDGKPNWQVKMKLEMDVDLKIVGFNYGTGKNSTLISSLNAESADGKVFTRPTGINESTMAYITDNQDNLLNTIVEVKCSGLSKDSDGNYSLLHPVFKTLRDDKLTCDSLESIVEIENMAKGLK